jgi:hypothetical protein
VSLTLDVLKMYLCKSRVHAVVQMAQAAQPHLVRSNVFRAIRPSPQQDHALLVWCMGQWLPLFLITHERSGLGITVATLSPQTVAELHDHIEPLITTLGGFVVLKDAHTNHNAQYRSLPDK